MAKLKLFTLFLLMTSLVMAQKRFQINGAARAYYFANNLDIDQSIDSITSRKSDYGHTLADLGISVFPNKQTEIISMFRIRNEFGGFWGAAVNFDVRQLTVKGVAAKRFRYEIGDIDLNTSKYTLWNFKEGDAINESAIFKTRRDIIYYDLFYNNNNQWRMQGAKLDFSLSVLPIFQTINVTGFLTRQKVAADQDPERLFGGGTIGLIKNDRFLAKIHTVNLFDLTGTIADSAHYRNNVLTGQIEYTAKQLKTKFSAESGLAHSSYRNFGDDDTNHRVGDWMADLQAVVTLSPRFSIKTGYKDIGPQFYSAGAQTRRVDFSQFPFLYQQITNEAIGRSIGLGDFMGGNTQNTRQISERLLAYNPALQNVNPYGDATPNRRGFYLHGKWKDTTLVHTAFIKLAMLEQSRGTGSLERKRFFLLESGTDFFLNELLNWKRELKLQGGVRFEYTNRGGETYEQINLQSFFADFGFSVQVIKKLDFIVGGKSWSASGNAFVNERNAFNEINNFKAQSINFQQVLLASGLSYDFGKDNILLIQYHWRDIDDTAANLAYGMSQFNVLFNLKF